MALIILDNIRRVPSISSISSASASSVTILPGDGAMSKEFDSMSIESNGLSPMTLQNIREQMAVSLKRMRQLEEQVKIIPILEMQLAALKAEKEQLLLRIREEEKLRLNNANYLNNNVHSSRTRSRSMTTQADDSGLEYAVNDRRHGSVSPNLVPSRRDFGVMCGVLTRNVGVGHQSPKTKTVATGTPSGRSGDKWLSQKLDFLIGNENVRQPVRSMITVAKGTQTILYGYKTQSTQAKLSSEITDSFTQTSRPPIKCFNSIGISIIPNTTNAKTQAFVSSRTVGVSDDTINSILCLKCTSQKQTVAVNTDDLPLLTHSVSLAQLSQPKADGNAEEENVVKTRTIGCQYDIRGTHRYTQYDVKSYSRSCQTETLKLSSRAVQNDIWCGISRSTDTKELIPETEEKGCDPDVCEKFDVGCGNDEPTTVEYCERCIDKEKIESTKKEEASTPSRIPRLSGSQRKFERQFTYTKIPAPISPVSPG